MATKSYPQETVEFWKNHIANCQESKQTKASYAKNNELDYNRFLYWIGRLKKTGKQSNGVPTELLPVRMITHSPSQSPPQPIASITIAGGYCIDFHDMNVLLQLLKQLKQ